MCVYNTPEGKPNSIPHALQLCEFLLLFFLRQVLDKCLNIAFPIHRKTEPKANILTKCKLTIGLILFPCLTSKSYTMASAS